MNKRDIKPWTEEEDNILRRYYTTKQKTIDEVCGILNRKKRTVQERIKKLQLYIRPSKQWTAEEIRFLEEHYPNNGVNYCARRLGRSRDSIWQKVSSLNISHLTKADLLNEFKDDIINDYNSGIKLKDIAIKYNSVEHIVLEFLKINKVPKLSLKNKHIKSKAIHWKGYMDITGTYWSSIVRSAKNRNIEFDIEISYAWNLFVLQDEKCALSGVPIQFNLYSQQFKTSQTASLDRIDSSKGYIKGNVQWVHKKINHMKMDLSDENFIDFCYSVCKTKGLI